MPLKKEDVQMDIEEEKEPQIKQNSPEAPPL
jgi:hypothetical protein